MPATHNYPIAANLVDAATFKAWGQAISTALQAAGGLVKTADTGQIDWNAVAALPAGNAYAGYEVYRFDDALQTGPGALPVFIKIEYGMGLISGGRYDSAIRVGVGTGTNGAGTLTGQTITTPPITGSSGNAGTSRQVISTAPNRLTLFIDTLEPAASEYHTKLVVIERLKDGNGADTATGIVFVAACYGIPNNLWGVLIPAAGVFAALDYNGVGFPNCTNASRVSGSDVGLAPLLLNAAGLKNPPIGALNYYTGDITDLSQITVPVYGVNRNYLCLGARAYPNNLCKGSTLNQGIAILFE